MAQICRNCCENQKIKFFFDQVTADLSVSIFITINALNFVQSPSKGVIDNFGKRDNPDSAIV